MKKLIIFLITTISIILPTTVNAETAQFYENEYLSGIYISRTTGNGTVYYQTARMYRQKETGNYAYCYEPFSFFEESGQYKNVVQPSNLTEEQKERIALIIHFGYKYKNQDNVKWYAISQVMIWQTAYPSGDYYFTDTLNGNRINIYQSEIEKIEKAIKDYKTTPSFSNKTYNIVKGESLELTDSNNILNKYTVSNKNATIKDNKLILNNLSAGEHEIEIKREDIAHNSKVTFYESKTSQGLVTLGNVEPKTVKIKVIVKETKVNINKLDNDTKTNQNSGEASLSGAKYQIMDKDRKELQIVEIDENQKATIENLPYGKYYIREIEAGIGYTLDNNIYEFEITSNNPEINLTMYNQVIKGKVTINKTYLLDDNLLKEENIEFNIYDKDSNLIATKKTNKEGTIEIYLPYGKYTIKQINTTEGYDIVEPFSIIIDSTNDLTYNLVNQKIQVPNTKSQSFPLIIKIINIILFSIIHA